MEAMAPENGRTISLDKGKQAYSIKISVKIAANPYCDMRLTKEFIQMIPFISCMLLYLISERS